MTNRPRLYPGHRHQWAYDLLTDPNWVDPPEDDDGDSIVGAKPPLVTCTVCGLQMPRNAAGLDGRMTEWCSQTLASGNQCGRIAGHPGDHRP